MIWHMIRMISRSGRKRNRRSRTRKVTRYTIRITINWK